MHGWKGSFDWFDDDEDTQKHCTELGAAPLISEQDLRDYDVKKRTGQLTPGVPQDTQLTDAELLMWKKAKIVYALAPAYRSEFQNDGTFLLKFGSHLLHFQCYSLFSAGRDVVQAFDDHVCGESVEYKRRFSAMFYHMEYIRKALGLTYYYDPQIVLVEQMKDVGQYICENIKSINIPFITNFSPPLDQFGIDEFATAEIVNILFALTTGNSISLYDPKSVGKCIHRTQWINGGECVDLIKYFDFQEEYPKDTFPRTVRMCAACGTGAFDLKHCARCKCTYYCGKNCQTKDWKLHKSQCRPPSEAESSHD